MADSKITALTSIGASTDPANDPLVLVDVSDTSMAATGTTKKVTLNQLLGASGTATLASATITGAATVGTTLGVTGVSSFAAGTAALPALTRTGDTNTGIYYPAADTVAVTTAGTERVRVNSSGQIGFGVVPEAWSGDFKALQLGYPNFIAGNDGAYRVDVGVNAYYDGGYRYAASSVAASLYTQASGAHNWSTKAAGTAGNLVSFTPVMSLDTSGNLTVANGNVILGTSGKGIDFSATSSGSGTMTSELLNDYEEGTWTGTLIGVTTNPTVPVTATGKYTKIGRQVTIVISFSNVSTVGASGVVGITGLPFTEDGERAVGTAALHTFDFDSGTSVYADVSGSTLFFSSQLTNAAWRDVKHNAGTGRYLRTTVTYNV